MPRKIMCDRCPRGDVARLFEALGERQAAEEIRAAGCPWWWAVELVQGAGAGRQVKVEEGCGVEYLPRFLTEYGARVAEALGQVQDVKNETAATLGRMEGAIPSVIVEALPGALVGALKAFAVDRLMEHVAPAPAALPPGEKPPEGGAPS
jgi:hypothetical protein